MGEKFLMKIKLKLLLFIAICIISVNFLTACTKDQMSNRTLIPNTWKDCQNDLNKASKIAGFNFPLVLSNFTVRSMKNMIEISYPLDEKRNVVVRKTDRLDEKTNPHYDISGDYNVYPKNKEIKINQGVPVYVRGYDLNKEIIVMSFAAESGYYTARCEQGMTLKEANGVFEVIKEAEEAK